MAIKVAIAKRVKRDDTIEIKAKVIRNVEVSNIGASKLDMLESSNLISILAEFYSLL